MLLEGEVAKVDRLPYQALITLRDTNIEGVTLVSVQDAREKVPIQLNTHVVFETFLWLANSIERVSKNAKTFINQETPKNGTIGCAKVILVKNDCSFLCEIAGVSSLLRVEVEKDINVEPGTKIKFKGELHAEV